MASSSSSLMVLGCTAGDLQLEMLLENRSRIIELVCARPSLLRVDCLSLSVAQWAAQHGDFELVELIDELDYQALFVVGQLHVPAIVLAAQGQHQLIVDVIDARIQTVRGHIHTAEPFGLGLPSQVHFGHAALIEWVMGRSSTVQQTLDYYLSTYEVLSVAGVQQGIFGQLEMIGASVERHFELHPWLSSERREYIVRYMEFDGRLDLVNRIKTLRWINALQKRHDASDEAAGVELALAAPSSPAFCPASPAFSPLSPIVAPSSPAFGPSSPDRSKRRRSD